MEMVDGDNRLALLSTRPHIDEKQTVKELPFASVRPIGPDSKSGPPQRVWVRVPPPAQTKMPAKHKK